MDETILLPSPNWFQVSGLAISNDGWLVYGGPSKSLCALEPIPTDNNGIIQGNQAYTAHVINRANSEKIVSIDISPAWPQKRVLLTGSLDGSVKQWNVEKTNNEVHIKSTHTHDVHIQDKEAITGVAYADESFAISIGCYGGIVKWDLNSNVVKTFNNFLKNMKPVSMSCSHHLPMHVAVGTKQGVVFVLDLNGTGKIVYKVRGQDEEIVNLSWCPQYEVIVKKPLTITEEKEHNLSKRLASIKNESVEYTKENEKVNTKCNDEHKECNEEHKKCNEELKDCYEELKDCNEDHKDCNKDHIGKDKLNKSGMNKNLPQDSFEDSVVQEDDMFDIYKDHEVEEFGHKKYQPEDIYVKVKVEEKKVDYLDECLKLKEEILKRKNESESSILTLVNALDKTHVADKSNNESSQSENIGDLSKEEASNSNVNQTDKKLPTVNVESSEHSHRHLLATIGKFGGVRIWSKSGKLVASCSVPTSGSNRNPRNKAPSWATLLWYKPDVLLIGDGKSQLLECNPLKIDGKNKLEWKLVHTQHKRGLFCIASNAPRVQSADLSEDQDWQMWTTSQDRNLISYSMKDRRVKEIYNTCGGFVYNIQTCPYDAKKIAISVGDGAVRVWEAEINDDEDKLSLGKVTSYWQNVQGKVLTVAWHPTKENRLAFGTAEARVGLIDTGGKSDKPARVLVPSLTGGVYSLCWGDNGQLYACGGGKLVIYNADTPDEPPIPMPIIVEGQTWEVCVTRHLPLGLLIGSFTGAVAWLRNGQILCSLHVFSKMIHSLEWHPQQTSNSEDESPYKNLISVCSLDKCNNIIIIEHIKNDDGSEKLQMWKTLSGHKGPVLQLTWNPHIDGMLMSTSQDGTVRIWSVEDGLCSHILSNQTGATLGANWMRTPNLARVVITGAADCTARMYRIDDHPAHLYKETKPESKKEKKKAKDKKEHQEVAKPETIADTNDNENAIPNACIETKKSKAPKKFLLPIMCKDMYPCKVQAVRKMIEMQLKKSSPNLNGHKVVSEKIVEEPNCEVEKNSEVKINSDINDQDPISSNGHSENTGKESHGHVVVVYKNNNCESSEGDYDIEFLKAFGTLNDVNELLDGEMERHIDTGNLESWMMLSIFRGHIDPMIQYASQRDLLCPFLVSMVPCVSLKYWKDVTQLYLAQIDRLVAKKEADKLSESRHYGGAIFRKVASLLSIHNVKAAVDALVDARLFKEAYVLCRIRYMESIAEQTLRQWGDDCCNTGVYTMAAVCYLALGNTSLAATSLGKTNDEDCLSLAAELAKMSGQNTFADHIEVKINQIVTINDSNKKDTEETLEDLPSKMALLMKNESNTENKLDDIN